MALVSLAGALMATAPAPAQTVPDAVRAPVTDEAGVLSSGDQGAVRRALDDARSRGIDLHVLFVRTTAGRPAESYTASVARASSMGGDDALLMVAFDDRTFGLWAADPLGVDAREVEAILDRLIAPQLRSGDVPGAVAATADGVARARSGDLTQPARPSGGGGGLGLLPLLLLGGVVLLVVSRFRRRMRVRQVPGGGFGPAAPAEPSVDLEALDAQANAALVQADDRLQDAEHESGFAEAQFGAEEAAALREALQRARTELREAFALRQRLDDHIPEPAGERAAMLEAVLGHVRAADEIAEDQLARLEELRGLERDPAAATAQLRARREVVAQRIPAAEAALAELRTTAATAAAAVEGNAAEAEKRLAFCDERLQEAASATGPEAARTLRAAGAALSQAEQLLDAADDLVRRVREARHALPQELQEAELALARAEDLVRSRRHVVGREARTRVVEARRHYDRARSLATDDPSVAATEADIAERLADEAFELGLRDSDAGGSDDSYGGGGGGLQGFGWGLPIPIPLPIPMGGGIGWGGTSWGGGLGGVVGGGSFGGGGGSVGGGRW